MKNKIRIFTSTELRNLKQETQRKRIQETIERFVLALYGKVIKFATQSDCRQFESTAKNIMQFTEEFMIEHSEQIIMEIKKYFPDSKISIKDFTTVNGKKIELSKIQIQGDDSFIDKNKTEKLIVINWEES